MDSIFASIYPKLTPEDQEVLRQEMRESFGYERELGAITGIELCKFILSERDEKRAVAALRTDATFQKALGRMEQRIAEAVAAEREGCLAAAAAAYFQVGGSHGTADDLSVQVERNIRARGGE